MWALPDVGLLKGPKVATIDILYKAYFCPGITQSDAVDDADICECMNTMDRRAWPLLTAGKF